MSNSTNNSPLPTYPTTSTSPITISGSIVTIPPPPVMIGDSQGGPGHLLVANGSSTGWVSVATQDDTKELRLMVEILFKTLGLINAPISPDLQALLFDEDKEKRDIAKKILDWLQPENPNE